MIDFGKFQQSRIAHNTFMPQHVRPSKAGGMPPMFESRPQVTTYTEINIDNTIGPKGFWGFALGFAQGILPFLGSRTSNQICTINQSQQTQIAQQPSQNNELANLRQLFGSKFTIIAEDGGKYTATDKNGKLAGNNLSYQDMKDTLSKYSSESQGTSTTNNGNGNVGNNNNGQANTPSVQTGKGNGANPDNEPQGGSAASGTGHSSGAHRPSGSPKGWYRAANDASTTVQSSKNKNASEVTSNVLGTKLIGVLNKQQQAELRQEIINKNPSVFDKNGNPKPNADYSKLDVPTMNYIEKKFGLQHGAKVVRQDDQYSGTIKHKAANGDYVKQDRNGRYSFYDSTGKAMSETAFRKKHPTINISNIRAGGYSSRKGTRVKGSEGRYAEKSGKGWKYYSSQGMELKADYIKKKDPQLYYATNPSARSDAMTPRPTSGRTQWQ